MMSKKNVIGIMGGTFNPIHNGHITLAVEAYKQFNLEDVLVMISPNPPHKTDEEILDIKKRVDMVKLAVSDYPEILTFSDFELNRSGYIYTAETLTLLNELHPENQYYFIIGGDSIKNIEKWYKPDIIFKNAIIIAAGRDEMREEAMIKHIDYLKQKYSADIKTLVLDNIPISSSKIRNNIKNNLSVSDMISQKVEKYIIENNLYE